MKNYVRPMMESEAFAANEYIAACVTGTIQCGYPGHRGSWWGGRGTVGDPNIFDDYYGDESGWYTDQYGMQHGVCGNDATISFNGNTGTGYEVVNGRVDKNRPIYGISGFDLTEGTYTGVTWTSRDGDSPEYHHVGRLVITNIDPTRPNHS